MDTLNILDPKQAAAALAKRFHFEQSDQRCIAACDSALLSPLATYVFFARYAAINGYAGPLVARLASTIGLSRGVFTDPSAPADVADRDMNVAARVFEATIDEFGDENQAKHTHRTLAQATVEAAAQYAGLSNAQRQKYSQVSDNYMPVLTSFINDYQGEVGNVDALVRALGYHVASELRADREYALIDEVFRHREKGTHFHAWLRNNGRVSMNGELLSAWYWIAAHGHYGGTGVEWEHFGAALDAARQARKYTSLTEQAFNQLFYEGFQTFLDTIDQVFMAIENECIALSRTSDVAVNEALPLGV